MIDVPPPPFHQAGGYTSHLYSKQIIELGHEHAALVTRRVFQDQFHVNVYLKRGHWHGSLIGMAIKTLLPKPVFVVPGLWWAL